MCVSSSGACLLRSAWPSELVAPQPATSPSVGRRFFRTRRACSARNPRRCTIGRVHHRLSTHDQKDLNDLTPPDLVPPTRHTRGDCPMRRGTSMCSGPGPRQSPLISSEPTSSWKRRTGRVWAHEHLARGEAANRAVAPGGFQAQPKIERLTIC